MAPPLVRVIHTVPAVSEEASGPSYSVVRLCESLIAEGENVTLTALDWAPMKCPPPFLKVFPLGAGPKRLGRSPAMRRWLDGRARSRSVDLIHNHSFWMMPNVYPGWVAKKYRIPLIVSPRGTLSEWAMQNGSFVKRIFWPMIQRPALDATTCFHATAESEYEDIRRMGFQQPVAIIPNGIDIPALPPQKPVNSRVLLFLGRIHPKKGLDVLLPAWQAVQDRFSDWSLRIVGPDNGGYLIKMKQLATDLSLKRIEFSNALYGEQKVGAYRDSDLFVLPTYSENFGMSVAEALASGIPAIVTKGAPWNGLITHNAGWWIDLGLDSLTHCLEHALSQSPQTLAEMGENGRTWMETEFSWRFIGQKMAETYQWVVYGGSKPAWIIEN